jgi:3D (Asp-Asp-Asp) domain-containing protein
MRFICTIFLILLFACGSPEPEPVLECYKLSATAYNSLPYQTRPGTPGNIAAWGDTLEPGMKSIAVSRDLIDSGFVHGAQVLIEGFEGDTFTVLDKMNYRFKRRIDIYMGRDVQKARNFGRQKRWVCLIVPDSSVSS